MEKKTNKATLEFFKFLRKLLNRKAITFDKIGKNCALSSNSIKIHLLGVFLHAEFISRRKLCKNLRFL